MEPTECAEPGCAELVNGPYCTDHVCATGGCSNPSSSGDGDRHCSTHECATDGCGEEAFINEPHCLQHQD